MSEHFEKYALGIEVEDVVSGFRGITIAKVVYLNGCIQYCVKPRVDKDGKMVESEYIDVDRLKWVGQGVTNIRNLDFVEKPNTVGGPSSDAPPERIK